MSHPTMGAWIEIIKKVINKYGIEKSHPTMGAWIEIISALINDLIYLVAPHDGCVD